MSSSNAEWNYPNLEQCRVVVQTPSLSSTAAGSQPPVRLPRDCTLSILNESSIPTVYDFALEQSVLEKYKQRQPLIEATTTATAAATNSSTTISQDASLSDREALKKNLVVEMKSVTGAEESICIALLESHSFDLKTSIETFFAEGSLREMTD